MCNNESLDSHGVHQILVAEKKDAGMRM
jgi:hypothetical protein